MSLFAALPRYSKNKPDLASIFDAKTNFLLGVLSGDHQRAKAIGMAREKRGERLDLHYPQEISVGARIDSIGRRGELVDCENSRVGGGQVAVLQSLNHGPNHFIGSQTGVWARLRGERR